MKSFRFRLLIAALAVVLGSALAKAQTTSDAPPPPPMHGPGMHGPGMHGPMMGFFARSLNLTDDQKTQMKAIMQKAKPTVQPLHQQARQIDQQIRQYVEGNYDEAKVRALAQQKAQLEVELTVAETHIHNQMYQVLTADQQAKVKQMEANREARMQKHLNQAPPAPLEQQ